jgi:hypothetical protein
MRRNAFSLQTRNELEHRSDIVALDAGWYRRSGALDIEPAHWAIAQ